MLDTVISYTLGEVLQMLTACVVATASIVSYFFIKKQEEKEKERHTAEPLKKCHFITAD